MPKKTIFVRDADLPLWHLAETAAGANLSGFLTAALRDYLGKEEFKEMKMQIDQHGPVVKRILFVWASRDLTQSAWGTSFDADGTGPDQARALISQIKRDPAVSVELEERHVYRDNWVDRRTLERWS